MASLHNQKTPPPSNEIEISVFGPGLGECIVAHVGGGRWIIIDSCIDRNKKRPVALAYLDEIGVNPSSVEMILITHWHDDHVAGIDEVVASCTNARFWCSSALRSTEFLQLLEIDLKRKGLRFTRGVKFIGNVVDRIGSDFNFALASMRIFRQEIDVSGFSVNIEAWTLSPSQAEHFLSVKNLGALAADRVGPEKTIPDRNPNHSSVALALMIGETHILLGADLEETGNPNYGWSAIINNQTRPQNFRASLFKIPHHGSVTGHCSGVWTSLTIKQPATAVTPYNIGRYILPQDADVARIDSLSNGAFITKTGLFQRALRRPGSTGKLIPGSLKRLSKTPGHIRFRRKIDDPSADWQTSLFDGAADLVKFNA
jgi:hypothetical protein